MNGFGKDGIVGGWLDESFTFDAAPEVPEEVRDLFNRDTRGPLGQPMAMSLEQAVVSQEAMRLFFGEAHHVTTPEFAMAWTTEREVSGEPQRKPVRTGWRGLLDRLTGRHHREWAEWLAAFEEWEQAGCPTKAQTITHYVPRARLTSPSGGQQ